MRLQLVPVRQRLAFAFVDGLHRHLAAPRGWLFGLGAELDGELVGVVIVGRPVARHFDDGVTCEVTRLCTDGTANACSFLYGGAWRAARSLGYRRIVTYTRGDEPGVTLRAAGWRLVGWTACGSWDRLGRPRSDRHELVDRQVWSLP